MNACIHQFTAWKSSNGSAAAEQKTLTLWSYRTSTKVMSLLTYCRVIETLEFPRHIQSYKEGQTKLGVWHL